MAKHVEVSENAVAELKGLKLEYSTVTNAIAGAKRRGNRAEAKSLNRSRNRISERMDQLKSQLQEKSY